MLKKGLILALIACFATPAPRLCAADGAYSVPVSSSTTPSEQPVHSQESREWVWWAVGFAVVAGIVAAIAVSSHHSGGSGSGGGY